MSARAEQLFRTALQVVAIALLLAIFAVLLHKGYTDITRLASEHAGADFWRALARYALRNMGAEDLMGLTNSARVQRP